MKLLTKRKQNWVAIRRTPLVQGTPVTPSSIVAARYEAELDAMIESMTAEVKREIVALFKTEHAEEFFAQDATISSQARITTAALTRKFNARFVKKAREIAERFANQSNKANATAVTASLKELSGGLTLPVGRMSDVQTEIMSASVTANVNLIKSISQKYLGDVQGAVMRSITTGNGLQDLVPFLARQKDITLRRARFIAQDQNRKISNDMTAARMKNLGLTSYKWRHTGGSDHPRKLHESYDGRVFRYDDPPVIDERTGEHGIPGQAPGCRCRQQVVLVFDE